MDLITLDFETFYSPDYSLSKMSNRDYITDPRFEAYMVAIKVNDGPNKIVTGPGRVRAVMTAIDWSKCAMLCHNSRFDAAVLSFHFGEKPALLLDTMAMAQATVFPEIGRASLRAVAAHFNLPPKGDELVMALGKTYTDFTEPELRAMETYCLHDNDLCYRIFNLLMADSFPPDELVIIDQLTRMYVDPIMELDTIRLAKHGHAIKVRKKQLRNQLGLDDRKRLMSGDLFAELLRGLGVEPPMKPSPSDPKKQIYAFAKTDQDFKELAYHENPDVQVAVEARLGHKSTIEETRCDRLLDIARRHKTLAVPLKYSGALTHRLSGDEKLNLQNLKRGSNLRTTFRAPPGYKLVGADLSQIEARLLAWMAHQHDLVEAFASGEDVYATFAGSVYQTQVTKETHPLERQVGKTGILSLGYGASGTRFHTMLRDNDFPVEPAFAQHVVNIYREKYSRIRNFWYACGDIIPRISAGIAGPFGRNNVFQIEKNKLVGPSGLALHFPKLHMETDEETGDQGWWFVHGFRRSKVYSSLLTAHCIQHLARVVVMDVAVRIARGHPSWRWALQVHDSLIYCVPEAEAEYCLSTILHEMAQPPRWAPEVTLIAEGGIGDTYAEAK